MSWRWPQWLGASGLLYLLAMSASTGVPWVACSSLLVVGVAALVGQAHGARQSAVWGFWLAAAAWSGSLVAVIGLVWVRARIDFLNSTYAELTWILAAIVGVLNTRFWRALSLLWGFLGSLNWLAMGYWRNLELPFYFGLITTVALLVLAKRWLRPTNLGIQGVNTLILTLVLLPLVDWCLPQRAPLDLTLATAQKYYSFESAQKNPEAFSRWWGFFLGQTALLDQEILMPDPQGVLPYRLRPNSHAKFFQSEISINSLGFRGTEIARAKDSAYRIVALGESTTFGFTLNADHKPWPAVLEDLIRQRLRSNRPVQVINAGVMGYTLQDNVHRLVSDILPLSPDLLISYHGYNGFRFLNSALPPVFGKPMPAYHSRPLKLLADCEYRMRMILYRRHRENEVSRLPTSVVDPMQSQYAAAYRSLVATARTNNIRLALANFSMAVNSESDEKLREFYGRAFLQLPWQIKANELHSRLVEEIVRENPGVLFVDTHPNLDGEHEKFIDLVHFSAEGDRQIAETVFASIKPILEKELH